MSVLPGKYDKITEVEDPEENIDAEMARHMPVCYCVMKNGCVDDQNSFFESPYEAMKSYLKPIFVKGKVENVPINKILVDRGATMNFNPHTILKKLGKYDKDTKPQNMVLSNYEGKLGTTLRALQVDLTIGTITRPTMINVVESKVNYNLLLGHEWTHDIKAVPSSMI